MTLRVAILGPGRAGRSLANALTAGGIEVIGLIGRDQPIGHAEVVIVTVRDSDLANALGTLRGLEPGTIVLHASGVDDPAEALNALRRAGHPAGTFHPLVPLANPDTAVNVLRHAWIGIDGDPEAKEVSRTLAAAIGAHPLFIPSGAKPGYHAAAVIAANFTAVLAGAAERELQHVGLEARAAHAAVSHLMRVSIANVAELGPERGLTGPVTRGDATTIARNLAALADQPAVRALYISATRIAVDLARASGADPEGLCEIEKLLLP